MEYFNLVGNPPKINSPYSSHYTQKLLPNRNKQRSLIQDIDIPLDYAPDYSLPSIYKETYILREVNEMYGEQIVMTSDGFSSTSTSTVSTPSSSTSSSSTSSTNSKRATTAASVSGSESASMSDRSYLTDSRIPNPLTPHVTALQKAMYEQADEDGEFELDHYDDDEVEEEDGEEEGNVLMLIDDLTQYTESTKACKSEKSHNSDPSSEKSSSNDDSEGEYDIDLSKLFSGQQKRAKKAEDRNKSTTSSTTSTTTSASTTPSAAVSSVSAKVSNKQRLSSILVRLADRPVADSNNTTSSSTGKGVVSKERREKTVESSSK